MLYVQSKSFVLGNLGHLYELTQQWSIAQNLTDNALNLSKSIQAEDIAPIFGSGKWDVFSVKVTLVARKSQTLTVLLLFR
jgi:hypothetical protein